MFDYLVLLLRTRNLARYIEDHPAAYEEYVVASRQIRQPKVTLPRAYITHEEQDESDPAGRTNQHRSNVLEAHDKDLSTIHDLHGSSVDSNALTVTQCSAEFFPALRCKLLKIHCLLKDV